MMAGTGIAGVDSAARMFRLVAVLTLIGMLLAGCASAPGTSRSAGQAPKQNCAACIEENPGDVRVCEKICHEHEGDTASLWAGSVLR
jgi:hypothetical protein